MPDVSVTRDKEDSLITAITSKSHVQLVDIISTRMLGQYGFLSKVSIIVKQLFLTVTLSLLLGVFSV